MNGDVDFNADGTTRTRRMPGYYGSDSFTYEICDVDGELRSATVTITIIDRGRWPVANDDSNTTDEDTPVSGSVTGNDVLW